MICFLPFMNYEDIIKKEEILYTIYESFKNKEELYQCPILIVTYIGYYDFGSEQHRHRSNQPLSVRQAFLSNAKTQNDNVT